MLRFLVRVSTWGYRVALLRYPRSLRRRFGPDMMEALESLLLDLVASRGLRGLIEGWWRCGFDLVKRLPPELAAVAASTDADVSGAIEGDTTRMVDLLGLSKELRLGLRALVRTPGFSGVVISTLAMGIGGTVAIFTIVNGVVLKPLPYSDPEQLVSILHTAPGMLDVERFGASDASYFHFRDRSQLLEDLGLFLDRMGVLANDDGPAERVRVGETTASLFDVLRIAPALGRALTPEDDQPGAPLVALIGHGLWERHFGADPGVVGQSIALDGRMVDVVGVLPEGFQLGLPRLVGGTGGIEGSIEIWLPLRLDPTTAFLGNFSWRAIGRLKAGAAVEDLAGELTRLTPSILDRYPNSPISASMLEEIGFSTLVFSLEDELVGDVRDVLWILLGSVGFVFLIACGNVANLILVRAESRQREIALRSALGAGRYRLWRQFFTEGSILALAGGAVGLALAYVGIRVLVRLGPAELPRLHEVGVDARVLAFALLVSIAVGLLFGLIPAARLRDTRLAGALKDGGRGATSGGGAHRARSALVVSQIALALVLLVGSGLMIRSFQNLRGVDPGYYSESVLAVEVEIPPHEVPSRLGSTVLIERMLERIRTLPGVVAAGAASSIPLDGAYSADAFDVEDRPTGPGEVPPAFAQKYVTADYFRTLEIPVLSGRELFVSDYLDDSGAVLVNRVFAEQLWPGQDALGKRLRPSNVGGAWYTVVGIVGDVREQSLSAAPQPMVYLPPVSLEGDAYSWEHGAMSIAVRVEGETVAVAPEVRREIWAANPNVPIGKVQSLERIRDSSAARTGFTMSLLGIAALVALVLGSVGIYGVIAFMVGQRTNEIGVRIAMGGRASEVAGLIVRQGAMVGLVGLGLGLVGAVALTRFLGALLFGVTATDPTTYGAVSVLIAAVVLLASYVPARRAVRLDPMQALRAE